MNNKIKEKNLIKELSNFQLSQTVEQNPETIVITDPEGKIEYVNARFTELTGYQKEEVIGKSPNILKTEYHDDQFYQKLWQTISSGKKWSGEFLNQKKNGDRFWEQASITPIFAENGEIVSYVGVKKDITEKKKIKKELQQKSKELTENKKMLNNILDLSTEAIRYVDLDYKIIKTNKRYDKLNNLYQQNKDHLKQLNPERLNCFQAFCTENCATAQCSIKLILNGHNYIQEDVEVELAGEKHYFLVSIVPYRNSFGKLKGIIQSYRDITKRKKNENKVKMYYKEIKELYAELEAEFEKGIDLHQQFLPKELPELNSLDYQFYFQPANRLGGDFYNVIEIGEQLLIYLVDVSGHGLDGSMLNIFLREIVNNYLSDKKKIDPVELLNFIIEKYHKEEISVEYMTCLILGVYDKNKKKFSFTNAGIHIPPLYISAEGEVKKIENKGVPISTAVELSSYGPGGFIEYKLKTINLNSGDLLFITTDGIIEEKNEAFESKQYGLQRLTEILQAEHNLSAAEITEKIKADFKNYAGTLIGQDDISFLVFKIK